MKNSTYKPVTHGAGDEAAQELGRRVLHHAEVEGVHEVPERREVRDELEATQDPPPEDGLGVFCGTNCVPLKCVTLSYNVADKPSNNLG